MVCGCATPKVYFLAAFVITDSVTCCSGWMELLVFPWLLELSVLSGIHKQNQTNPAYPGSSNHCSVGNSFHKAD